jgi:hypothetical protein
MKHSLISFIIASNQNLLGIKTTTIRKNIHLSNLKSFVNDPDLGRKKKLTANADGSTKVKKNWLREENLSSVDAKLTNLRFRKLNLFSTFSF